MEEKYDRRHVCTYVSSLLVVLGKNSQFSPQPITQSSISSLDYETSRFSPQTFVTGSILSLNYENGNFGPQNFTSGSNSSLPNRQIPFLPYSYPYSPLAAARIEVVGRPPLRWSRGLAPPSPSAPTPHPWSASATAAPKIHARRHSRRCQRGGFGGAASRQTGGADLRGDKSDSEEQREQRVPE
jgi:hypothetical protein